MCVSRLCQYTVCVPVGESVCDSCAGVCECVCECSVSRCACVPRVRQCVRRACVPVCIIYNISIIYTACRLCSLLPAICLECLYNNERICPSRHLLSNFEIYTINILIPIASVCVTVCHRSRCQPRAYMRTFVCVYAVCVCVCVCCVCQCVSTEFFKNFCSLASTNHL